MRAIQSDAQGQLWVAGTEGVTRFDAHGHGRNFGLADGMPGTIVFAFARASTGGMWAGTLQGVARIDGDQVQVLAPTRGDDIRALYEDPDGRLWIGQRSGLRSFHAGVLDNCGTDGLPGTRVFAFLPGADGELWLGTSVGLVRMHNGNVTAFTQDAGFYGDSVFALFDDGLGNFWFSSNRGIGRIARAGLQALQDGGSEKMAPHWYGLADGMLSAQGNGASQTPAARSEVGCLWFGTAKSLTPAGRLQRLPLSARCGLGDADALATGESAMTAEHSPAAPLTTATAMPPMDWSLMPVAHGSDDSLVLQFLQRVRNEPALLFTTAYLLLSMLGLWCSYWFYRGFKLPVLDYLQVSDFLVAGVRDPMYALVLMIGVAIVLLVSWPETLRLRNPQRVAALCARHRLWRMLFTPSALTSWQSTGLRPLTAMTVAVALVMVVGSASYVVSRAEVIRAQGRGNPVQVQFVGAALPAPHTARLLGTSSAFVFLWWPHQRRAEAVPIATIARLQAPVLEALPTEEADVPPVPVPRPTPVPHKRGLPVPAVPPVPQDVPATVQP